MTSTVAYTHADAYKLPAGLLAFAAHALFFIVLYFGVNWQSQPAQGMAVELWSDLPETNVQPVAPPPAPAQPEQAPPEPAKKAEPVKPQPQPEPALPKQAEIEMAQKKKKQPAPKDEAKAEKKPLTKAELLKAKKEAQQASKEMQESIRQQEQAEQAEQAARAQQAAAAAAVSNEVGKYKGLIIAKVRRNVVLPPDVDDNAQAEFSVTLLPGGEVFEVTQTRKSGNAAYDAAVERAIWKSSPLPVPTDTELFRKNFRNLHLKFKPKD